MLFVLLLVTINLIKSSTMKQFLLPRPRQSVRLNNQANSNSNAFAVNTGLLGDANAFSGSNASNVNFVSQQAQQQNQPTP
jgi:hypothetical protein